ncbi:flavodoxin family protein [Massiliimalia massiliensis]|uniref:flavodoxin family protein n=1 Tax=Massiliimalia massiliensis TaxID=1852384 RepID=UPI0009869DED|nr:NAD(P)H-dependent oxidoreductase [Massiliimalia massiliensis]
MKIVVLNGTSVKGITYHMKEMFLQYLRTENQITEFYPEDMPPFCVGCKNCFLRGEERCPHAETIGPIWDACLAADLLVFAYPVYALRAPASIKSVLDHFCVHWMVHRPDPKFFKKTAVVITNSVGAPNGSAQKDVKTSMNWMGVSKIHTCGAGMMGDIFWSNITDKHQKMLEQKMTRLAKRVSGTMPRLHKSFKVNALFSVCKMMHQGVLKSEDRPSLDNQFFLDKGWIRDKR